jgi:hypothetical protein
MNYRILDKIFVEIDIDFELDFDIKEFDQALNISEYKERKCRNKGEEYHGYKTNGPILIQQKSFWMIGFDKCLEIESVPYLEMLTGVIEQNASVINHYVEKYQGTVNVSVVYYCSEGAHSGFALPKEFVNACAEIKASLEFPIYLYSARNLRNM